MFAFFPLLCHIRATMEYARLHNISIREAHEILHNDLSTAHFGRCFSLSKAAFRLSYFVRQHA